MAVVGAVAAADLGRTVEGGTAEDGVLDRGGMEGVLDRTEPWDEGFCDVASSSSK